MLPFDKALQVVLDSAGRLGGEGVDLAHAANRSAVRGRPLSLFFMPALLMLAVLSGDGIIVIIVEH